ncbi:hypothetical protein DAPPUDRAFT_333133 [Daphnia pulex]|uniref:Dynein heavy chain linker domain-containing protein n=1 Tax=Daphnia pulex TaxID=6669 RepID=E9HRY7_DAPPU|nr:hypothetical protein DAPPUDRAFT_333133 [Daphnia pulex]|eukprot:EFX65497.1 hypothetical protein DAPPUDRAFT_333133 [Daphnia pulex]
MTGMKPVFYSKPRGSYSIDNVSLRARLFQLMITRIPKLVQPVDHSVWAMQELTDINTKCMKRAAISQPERPYNIIIRAPVPWNQQYLIAREFATHNIFATHSVSLEIRKLLDSTYRSCRLFESSWEKKNSLDPDLLLELIRKRCSHLQKSLIEKWIPECCAVLNRHLGPHGPIKTRQIVAAKPALFNSLTRLISLQIRCLLYSWIEEWKDLMSSYQAGNDDDHVTADEFPKVFPFIRLELALSNRKVFVKPKHERIQRMMEKVLQTIVSVSWHISRIERIFLSVVWYTGGEEFLVSIAWENDHVQSVLKKVKQVVNSNKKVPEWFIRDTYAKYEPLLQQPFSELYGETDDMIWDKNEKLFKKRMGELSDIKKNLLRLKSHVYLKLFFLDCHQLNKHLVDFIDDMKSSLVTIIMKDNRHIVRQISTRFETVTEKVSHVPDNTAELVESVDFVNKSQNEILPEMLQEVNAAGARLLTLLNYTMLQKDDLSLSCRLFHWPSDLDSVLQVSSNRLLRIRIETERALKERTQLFLERLEDYGEVLENFKNKEAMALTTEEMKNSTTLLQQDLHQQLQAALLDLEEINNDEALLEFPFQKSHDVWFLGPFSKLDSQMIADEITAMYKQMQQLAIVFADVSAAKRVTETIRKRIEKFMGYLPLLHSVCNPGLRDRHWILISQNFESPLCPEPDIHCLNWLEQV